MDVNDAVLFTDVEINIQEIYQELCSNWLQIDAQITMKWVLLVAGSVSGVIS